MSCQSNFGWFELVKRGDLPKTTKLIRKYARKYDQRDTDPKNGIYHGFCAIHYAVFLGNMAAFRALEPYEADCLTADAVQFDNPFHSGCFVSLARGSNCLQLALLRGVSQISEYVANKVLADDPAYRDYVGRNANGVGVFATCLAIPHGPVSTRLFSDERLIRCALTQECPPAAGVPRLMALLNRPEHRELLARLGEDPRYREMLVGQLLARDRNGTAYDVAKATRCWWVAAAVLDALEWCMDRGHEDLVRQFFGSLPAEAALSTECSRKVDVYRPGTTLNL